MSSDTISVVFPTDEWEALKDLLDGEGAPLDLMGDLEQRGFLENGALSQSAAKLLQAYQQAAGAVRLYVCDAGVVREARTWVAKDRSVLLDITDGEVTVLRRQEPGQFPLTLLEMLGIGPRPRLPEGALPGFSARIIRDLLRPSDSDRNAKARDDLAETLRGVWPAASEAIKKDDWRLWLIQSFDVAVGEPQARTTVCVLDTSAGMVGITVDDDTAVPVAVTSLEVWRAVAAAIAPWS
ncbi:hypothetical protein HMPREF0972_00898 [Actinomyces sp. oral taxon 848 str. F0332]|nr:hypothetical protein HMPREF0972_00898 [Actinomyces sp. oral taxon 848 str. F0332]